MFRRLSPTIAIMVFIFSLPSVAEINEFKNKFMTLRAYLDIPSYQIDIQSKVSSNHVLWKPNIRVLTGVDVSINGFLGGGIGWANNVSSQAAAVQGNTTYSDYRLGLTLKSFHGEANYQTYQGFYVDNTGQVDPSVAATGVDIQDPNMTANNISANGTFIASPERFSYTAAIGQDARQESSGGSFLFGLAASETAFSSTNYLIPATVRSTFGDDQRIKNAQFYSLSAKAGYGYTVAWTKKWFTTLIINLGFGGEYRSYGDGVTQTQAGGGTTKVDAVFSLGYNGDSFLAAIIAEGDDTTYTTQSLQIPAILGDARIALGAHF